MLAAAAMKFATRSFGGHAPRGLHILKAPSLASRCAEAHAAFLCLLRTRTSVFLSRPLQVK
jgi:hypothetical protein